MKPSKKKTIPAKELDRLFDEGKDITPYLDMESAKVCDPLKRINIDIPAHILKKVDAEADRIGVPRTALIKLWLSERVDRLAG